MQVIEYKLDAALKQTYQARKQVREIRRSIWEELQFGGASSFEQDVEAVQYLDELSRQGRKFGINRQNLTKLRLLKETPYFGRIDFYDDELDSVKQIYIGVASLIDEETGEHLVYDWRAPVSSMFYDYGLGKAQYQSPGGIITGEILLKRQYKIENGEIKYVFDSELAINDDILQDTLSKSADNRMRSIIYSIQREQNQAIRDESTKVLLVQGPAGSGKTSIALHRAAYLLYRYHSILNADHIVIFSPNQIFSDYISNVLPELGEENICQATMQEYIERKIDSDWDLEDYYTQYEYILNEHNPVDAEYENRIEAIRYKSSLEFFQLVKAYLEYIKDHQFIFSEIRVWDHLIMTKQECEELFYKTYRYLPVKSRLDKIRRRVHFLLNPIRKSRINNLVEEKAVQPEYTEASKRQLREICINIVNNELADVYEQMASILAFNSYQFYTGLFQERDVIKEFFDPKLLPDKWDGICEITQRSFREQKLFYEDAAPLLYLDGIISGWDSMLDIKHVIVDEAQDYSLFHYEILRNTFPKAAFTILGDLNQAFHPYMKLTDFSLAKGVFEKADLNTKHIYLTKSYRSTKQITAFTNSLLPVAPKTQLMERTGIKPQVIAYQADPADEIIEKIELCQTKGCRSVAVICKTELESAKVAQLLEGKIEFSRISREETRFLPGVVVLAVYLAKGLEFDAVIIYNAGAQTYRQEAERNILYTACTRALHYLYIFYDNDLTHFIKAVDEELYELK